MNHRQIEVFVTIMRAGTASKAAELLRVSQPAISKTIQDLERSIGFQLFDRVRGRMIPTPEARLFQRKVNASFIGMEQLRYEAARIRDVGSGEVKLASLGALAHNIVPRALGRFKERYSNVALTFQSRLSNDISELVMRGEFDLGIVANEVDLTGLWHRPFTTFRACVAVYPGHPLAHLDAVHPKDLDGQDFIALAPKDTVRIQAENTFQDHCVNPRIILETPLSSTVCAMVSARLGCGIVNPLTARDHSAGDLILKPFEPAIQFRSVLIARSEQISQPVSALIRFLEEAAQFYGSMS